MEKTVKCNHNYPIEICPICHMSNNPKDNTPPPEERARIVAAMEADFAKRQAVAQTEWDELLRYKNEAKATIKAAIAPILTQAQLLPPGDRRSIHHPEGAIYLKLQLQKMYLDYFTNHKLSREESLFLLSFAWAELTANEFI